MESEPDKRYKIEEQSQNGVKRKEDPLVNEPTLELLNESEDRNFNEPFIKESNFELPENKADSFFNEELTSEQHLALKTDLNTDN